MYAASTSARMLLVAMLVALTCVAVMFGLISKENRTVAAQQDSKGPKLAHMVYFTLQESTPENRAKLVAACNKHLTDHPGTVFFGVGTVVDDLDRPVNVRDWDVGLHLVFDSRAAHDKYQTDPRHLRFIEENRASWKSVRVFDAYLE